MTTEAIKAPLTAVEASELQNFVYGKMSALLARKGYTQATLSDNIKQHATEWYVSKGRAVPSIVVHPTSLTEVWLDVGHFIRIV